jgi:transketolase C-terminal domain/subunit
MHGRKRWLGLRVSSRSWSRHSAILVKRVWRHAKLQVSVPGGEAKIVERRTDLAWTGYTKRRNGSGEGSLNEIAQMAAKARADIFAETADRTVFDLLRNLLTHEASVTMSYTGVAAWT